MTMPTSPESSIFDSAALVMLHSGARPMVDGARRLPKGRKAKAPGELVQIDTLFVNVRPDEAIKHFTAYDPVAKWTIGRVAL